MIQSTQVSLCVKKGWIDLYGEIRSVKTVWQFQVIAGLKLHCIVGLDYMRSRGINLNFLRIITEQFLV